MKNPSKIFFWWLTVLAWMGVIYYFSAQPNLKSELLPVWDLIFRKIAHMAEFFILAYLFFNAYQSLGLNKGKSLLLSLFFALAYAGCDEWHQTSVIGRSGSIIDVMVDGIGIVFFGFLRFRQR